ncbi:MAG: helix-turn-helix domain-containing protein [Clostridia bacterium]|nr:helix-turn-helix domain-containing protein [Clostridia bacterium]
MENVGEKIFNLRKQKGVSQEELAFALKTTRQTVSKWENNLMQPSIENLKSVCDYFSVDANYFFDFDESSAVNVEEVTEEKECQTSTSKTDSQMQSKMKSWKALFLAISVTVLALISIVCAIIGYMVITPDQGQEVVSVDHFNYAGIICVIVGIISLVCLVTIIVLIVKNKTKK